ncbi:hypothetical protein GYB22_09435 [bacterium]|nr:hypothetical protein [bacterium]
MSIKFTTNQIFHKKGQVEFLKIGEKANELSLNDEVFALSKYRKVEDLWGTLGWKDEKKKRFGGDVEFSKRGNKRHRGVTAEIAQNLADLNVELDGPKDILERFITLNTLDFGDTPEKFDSIDQLMLRFNLFLNKDEGALVYLQHHPKGKFNSKQAEVQLITPEPVDENGSQDRFTLTYYFPYFLDKTLKVVDGVLQCDNEKLEGVATVLKILTFKRQESDLKSFLKKAFSKFNKKADKKDWVDRKLHKIGLSKYDLLMFTPNKNKDKGGTFKSIADSPSQSLNPNKSTLLLLHGTFSDTAKSFKEFYHIYDNDQSYLQHLLSSGKYEQVVAFDHPTASHSPLENTIYLYDILGDFNFNKPVDVITTSRGALVGAEICAYDKMASKLKVRKMLMFSPAFGCDFLTTAKNIDLFLSISKKYASGSGWAFALALAQFSVDRFRNQPGLEAMRTNSPDLIKILNSQPNHPMQYRAMVGDWKGFLTSPKILIPLMGSIDAMLWLIFRSPHDWVIGTPEQRLKLLGSNAIADADFNYHTMHCRYFEHRYSKTSKSVYLETWNEINQYFHN